MSIAESKILNTISTAILYMSIAENKILNTIGEFLTSPRKYLIAQ